MWDISYVNREITGIVWKWDCVEIECERSDFLWLLFNGIANDQRKTLYQMFDLVLSLIESNQILLFRNLIYVAYSTN